MATLEVGGDLDVGSKSVFGVDVPHLESTRVSLTKDQTLNGNYHFSTLNVGGQGCNFPMPFANKLVATLPTWGKHFSVSFEMFVGTFHPTSDWTEFLRFTATEKDCCKPGNRIPALFVNNKKKTIYPTSQVGSNGDYWFHRKIEAGTWIKVDIKQYPENGKTMYEVLVDGVREKKVENTIPTEYKNVKVWVGLDTWHPGTNGSIRNLKAGKIAKSIFSFIIMNNFLDGIRLLDVSCPLVDGGNEKSSYYASFANMI